MSKKDSRLAEGLKSIVTYHRSYRTLPGSIKQFLCHFCIMALPFAAIIVVFYPQITRTLCLMTKDILSPFFFADTIKLVEISYIKTIGNISFLDLPGQYPTPGFALGNAVFCLALLIFLPRINQAKPFVIFSVMITSIHFVSSLFFLFFPWQFPYGAADYSQLYMVQQVGIWFFVPLIIGVGVMPLPSSIISKCITMTVTYIYSMVFGILRYIVFLFILAKVSLLYMAVLFFALGPLIDFIYVVGIYSVHVTRLANKLKGEIGLWQWL